MFLGGSIIKDIKKEQTSFGIWVKLFFFSYPAPRSPVSKWNYCLIKVSENKDFNAKIILKT